MKETNYRGTNDSLKSDRYTNDRSVNNRVTGPKPEVLTNDAYVPGYLRTQIGKLVRVEFLIGTGFLNDRVGRLREVGASYIVLDSLQSDSEVMCDIYSIKFVTIIGERVDEDGNDMVSPDLLGNAY